MKILKVMAAITLVGILLLELWYVQERQKRNEEYKSSRKATFDSLLELEPITIRCTSCGTLHHTNLRWVTDSAR